MIKLYHFVRRLLIYGHFDTAKQIFAERGWKLCETEVNTQAQGDYHWSFLRVTGDLNKLLGLDQGFAGSWVYSCACCFYWTRRSRLIDGGRLPGITTSKENEYRWRPPYSLITRIMKVADDQQAALINGDYLPVNLKHCG